MNFNRLNLIAALALILAAASLPALASDKIAIKPPVETPLKLVAGKQTLLRSREKIHRTAVTDPSICAVNQFSASELAIVARAPGKTQVIVWFASPENEPLIYEVEVR